MCGIFGYYNYAVSKDRKAILETLFSGLKRLEYRGYDSAGISFDSDSVSAAGTSRSENDTGSDSHKDSYSSDSDSDFSENGAQSVAAIQKSDADTSATSFVIKSSGNVKALIKLAYEEVAKKGIDLGKTFDSHAGLAHTRWATHGMPSAINSHPQVSDPNHSFIVVHNGIITNYRALKKFLINKGETFISETDTEILPKLCKYIYSGSEEHIPFHELVLEVLSKCEGAYGLLLKSAHYPGELVACKRGSPLLLGIKTSTQSHQASPRNYTSFDGGFEAFIASDASAIVEHTHQVLVLEDNDLLHLAGGAYSIFNLQRDDLSAKVASVSRAMSRLDMEVSSIMKSGYDHYMQKEIHEQPESIRQTMRGRLDFHSLNSSEKNETQGSAYHLKRVMLGGLVDHYSMIKRSHRFVFIACGTSYHASLACRQTVEELAELPVSLELASDLLDRQAPIYRGDICIFVSQSGETADTLKALEYAKMQGAMCIGVTNTVGSAIARSTHCGVHINAGCEIGVASTKAYTSQMVTLTMMALAMSEDSIRLHAKRNDVINALGMLTEHVKEALKLDSQMMELAKELKTEQSLLVFGRGYNYATALEAALKVKEVALMHSEGLLAGEMKHGPLALVDEHLPIIVIATRDRMYGKMLSVVQQLLARGARLTIVCNAGDTEICEICTRCKCRLIEVPLTVECLQPIVNIVPLQLLAYHLAIVRGYNVDQPRNLAKSVTVSEEH